MASRLARRLLSSHSHASLPLLSAVARKRVFGICAHVDAGKTTVSERMLYYSGALQRMGNVESGDTVMDFLPAERERGITINSAAVSLSWRGRDLSLVDSPGHLDFTYEVQRALRVMDGVVIVLDAVAGVQPQTETVWRQADHFSLPRIVFVNKMDRAGADLVRSLASLSSRLRAKAAVLHWPIVDPRSGEWTGFVDLVTLERVDRQPTPASGVQDSRPTRDELRRVVSAADVCSSVSRARERLVEVLADVDDDVMEAWVGGEEVGAAAVKAALRRATVAGLVVPVLCGSALKNTGVQALLDAVVDYLPSPSERASIDVTAARPVRVGGDLLALAFKVTHDAHRGQLVYMRAFCGELASPSRVPLFNVSKGRKEVPTALLRVMADDAVDASAISTGDIFAAVGMKHTTTGDTVSARRPGRRPADGDVVSPLQGVPSPPAVVSVAVEAESTSQQRQLDAALARLLAEDPSLRLSTDARSGETLLSGMGQLHLDVVIDRLSKTLRDPIHVSKPRVAYRETVTRPVAHSEVHDNVIGTARHRATLSLALHPLPEQRCDDNQVVLSGVADASADLAASIRKDVLTALGRGPLLGSPTVRVRVTVTSTAADLSNASSPAALSACTNSAVSKALAAAGPVLLEPVMKVHCTVPDSTVGAVIGELTHLSLRRGVIDSVDRATRAAECGDGTVQIFASVPLAGMVDWATRLRSVTKGRGAFSMEFKSYQPVGQAEQQSLLAAK
jgi:elongation factor G